MGPLAILNGLSQIFSASRTGRKPKPLDATKTAATIIDNLFNSEEEKLDKQILLARVLKDADKLQAAVNKIEIQHRSLLVAGWRPFIGWTCGVALAWHFIAQPMLMFLFAILGGSQVELPQFDLATLNTILFGMLGLGTLRTAEKAAGHSR